MKLIRPDWSAPPGVEAFATTREGGFSEGRYRSFNLGDHVGDEPAAVERNRRHLIAQCSGLEQIQWLRQVHGREVVEAKSPPTAVAADAALTAEIGLACAILTADCLPVLMCDSAGRQVAAIHAGWRGLCAGVVAAAVDRFDARPEALHAWIGPAISQPCFEVGAEVREQFLQQFEGPQEEIAAAFLPSVQRRGHYLADLAGLCRAQLAALGVGEIRGGDFCTYSDERFYSYRRDGVTGRMVSLIYKV